MPKFVLIRDTRSWSKDVSFHETRAAIWASIKDLFDEVMDTDADECYQECWELHKDSSDFSDTILGEFLIVEVPKVEDEDLHGHIVCVRPSDLEDHFSEDAQYITQEMLEDMSDRIFEQDRAAWTNLFDRCLGFSIGSDWEFWYDKIQEEKKRRNTNE